MTENDTPYGGNSSQTPANTNTPAPVKKGCTSLILPLFGLLLSGLYLLNFTMGVIEIPDNLPIIGNLDEFIASGIFIACLRHFGIDLTSFFSHSNHPQKK